MTKLDDTSMMILSGASARTDMKVFPLPGGLQPDEAKVKKSLTGLVRRGLLAGVGATRDDVAWAEDEEGGRTTLIVTPSGLHAINIEPDNRADVATDTKPTKGNSTIPAAMKKPTSKTRAANKPKPTKQTMVAEEAPAQLKKASTGAHKRPAAAKSGKGGTKPAKSPRTAAKGLTKQQIVVGMLRRANGASIAELAKATDWQPHSVRGVLTATVKKRLNLPLVSEKGEDGVRRYYVAPIRRGKE